MMQGYGSGSFFGMGPGMLAIVVLIFLAGMAAGYLIGRGR